MYKANDFLTDLLISRFVNVMGGLDTIELPTALENELKKDELLRQNINNLMSSVTPYLPYLGIPSGNIIVG